MKNGTNTNRVNENCEQREREGEKSVQVKAWKLHGKCPLDGKRIEKLIADFMHELGAVKFYCIGHR